MRPWRTPERLQALTFLRQAGRVDLQRVLVLRTVSNYDREAPGTTAADSLKAMASGNYSAYMADLEAAQSVGDKVVRDIVGALGRARILIFRTRRRRRISEVAEKLVMSS